MKSTMLICYLQISDKAVKQALTLIEQGYLIVEIFEHEQKAMDVISESSGL